MFVQPVLAKHLIQEVSMWDWGGGWVSEVGMVHKAERWGSLNSAQRAGGLLMYPHVYPGEKAF